MSDLLTREETAMNNELPGMLALAEGVSKQQWPHTMDAQVWAKEWLKTLADNPGIATDEGTMIGWFANAIMAGYDTAHSQGAPVPGGGHDAGSAPEQNKQNAVVQDEPEGWVSVPLEPTEKMLDAGGQTMFVDVKRKTYCDIVRRGWKAMLAAKPSRG